MEITIGYVGVLTVTVAKSPVDDRASVLGVDPAHEMEGFEYDEPNLLSAWNRAVKEIVNRGGTILNDVPTTEMIVIGQATDICPVAQCDATSLDDAAAQFDRKRWELEDSLCKGWNEKRGNMSTTFVDKDGYEVTLTVMSAPKYHQWFAATYIDD